MSSDENNISSHNVFMVKVLHYATLLIKASIAPHGNEDSRWLEQKYDISMRYPIGIRVVLMVAVVLRWYILKYDVKTAFCKPVRRTVMSMSVLPMKLVTVVIIGCYAPQLMGSSIPKRILNLKTMSRL